MSEQGGGKHSMTISTPDSGFAISAIFVISWILRCSKKSFDVWMAEIVVIHGCSHICHSLFWGSMAHGSTTVIIDNFIFVIRMSMDDILRRSVPPTTFEVAIYESSIYPVAIEAR
jgi:hypothetical protein